ncbi:MAG: DUF6057 family protein [Pirellulales bacterium]|jgi:hypothetical protein|nr:DUF6057 family protein [Thermoguttaceae bacterium]MDD4786874.1 DUF6057 family protein [Pirellulales bacterium]MDI9445059.1 DUF6057 family protein [Planctomycetota bacterium]
MGEQAAIGSVLNASEKCPSRAFLQRVPAPGAALFPPRLVLLLVLFAGHVQVVVDPRCVFFAQNDLFLWNFRFFRDFLLVPGGLTAWLGELLLQACHFGWPGTLMLTAIAWLMLAATIGFMKSVAPSGAGVMWTAPAVVLCIVHSHYDYHFSVSIGAALAMVAALVYVRGSTRGGAWPVVEFAGLCALLYYAAGIAFYVFALCVMIWEVYRPGRRWTILGLAAGAIVARFAVEGALALVDPGSFYLHVPPALPFAEERSLRAVAVALYASFPLCALLLADRESRRRREPGQPRPGIVEAGLHGSARPGGRLGWLAVTTLVVAAAALAGRIAARPDVRTVLALHNGADGQRWDEVLRLGARVPPDLYSSYVVHDVNMALYETGRLPFDMFSYRQFGSPFVLETQIGPYTLSMIDLDAFTLRRLGDFHLRLGRVNDAEYYVHESFVRRPCAECLRLLARIAMVKGQVEQVRLFLCVLRDDLVYGSWAADWLKRLQQEPGLVGDAEIARIRSLGLAEEDIHQAAEFIPNTIIAGRSVSTREQVASLLRQNPRNRMAFEYLMAVHLVDTNVGAVAELLPKAADFYPGTPPLYEEAAMIYARAGKDNPLAPDGAPAVNGCAISEQTLGRIRKLDEVIDSGRSSPAEIASAAEEVGLACFHFYYGRRGD